jgi:D-galactose 1-dehydrogenase
MVEIRIGIIGYGKIARVEHAPAIAGDPGFRLVGVVAPQGASGVRVPVFSDHRALLAAGGIDAVAICTPAGPRYVIARDCLNAGFDVLLEKPPAATLGEVDALSALSQQLGRVVFTTWHAQYNEAVAPLQELLAHEGLGTMQITWLEDVNRWHPDQRWIWEPGGFGVFDAGINALSIAAKVIAPAGLIVNSASFELHPSGQQPIAASLALDVAGQGATVSARFDWRHTGEERWDMEGKTAAGSAFLLSGGGSTLTVNGKVISAPRAAGAEYRAIYAAFGQMVRDRRSLIDAAPLRLVADANLIARREPAT